MLSLSVEKTSSRYARGYVICFVGTVLWSSTGVLIRYLTETFQLPSLVLAVWRDFFVALAIAGAFLILKKHHLLQLDRAHLRFFILFGIVLALFNSMWTVSVSLNGAAVSTVLAYSSAAFTAILGRWLLHEKLGPLKITAVALSMLGCVFVSGAYDPAAWRLNTLGIITGLISGIMFACYSLMGKTASNRSIHPWTTMLYAFAFAAVFLLAFNGFFALLPGGFQFTGRLLWLGTSVTGWGVLLFLAIGPTIGGYGLYTVSLTHLPASVANLIATLEPALTAVQAYLLLGEKFTVPQIFGSLLILSGVVLLRLMEGR